MSTPNFPINITNASVNTGTDTITSQAHGLTANQPVSVSLRSPGSLPAPLVQGVRYFAVGVTTDTFQLALTSGGSAIDLTTQGSGTFDLLASSVTQAQPPGPVTTPGAGPDFTFEAAHAGHYPRRHFDQRERKMLSIIKPYVDAGDAATLAAALAASTPATTLATDIMGAFKSYAGLAGAGITNTGGTVITGDIATSPTATITGFPPGTVSGTQHPNDASAIAAQVQDVYAASFVSTRPAFSLSGSTYDAANTTLAPGNYSVGTSFTVGSGTLTLDAGGNANARWVIRAGSTFSLANSTSIVLVNGAQVDNVFFYAGTSATLGTSSTFRGNLVAAASITLTTSATVHGRLWCKTGALTLDTNAVSLT